MFAQPIAAIRQWGLLVLGLCVGCTLPALFGILNAAPPPKVIVEKQPPSAELKAVLGMKLDVNPRNRVIITDVAADSPASRIGVEKEDIIVSFDGKDVTTVDSLVTTAAKTLAAKQPGDEVKMVVSRGGVLKTATLVVPERQKPIPDPVRTVIAPGPVLVERDVRTIPCIQLREVAGGRLVVERVNVNSTAQRAGLLVDDVVVSVGELKVATVAKFDEALGTYAAGQKITLGVVRGNQPMIVRFDAVPCRQLPVAAAVGAPRDPLTPESLELLAAKVKALQVQIEDLRATAAGLSSTIDTMRTQR